MINISPTAMTASSTTSLERPRFRAQREARTHAKRNKRHTTSVLNVTRLEIMARHYYEPLEVVEEPPF